jgi:hypothetical protein
LIFALESVDLSPANWAALAAANIPPEEALAPPPRDRAAAGYCPRCERCVRAGIDTCIDCGGIPIVDFPAAAAAPDAAANPGPTP